MHLLIPLLLDISHFTSLLLFQTVLQYTPLYMYLCAHESNLLNKFLDVNSESKGVCTFYDAR